MDRAVIRNPAAGEDLTSAILQFKPEEPKTHVVVGKSDGRWPSAAGQPRRPGSSSLESFFSEELDSFPSEKPVAAAVPETGFNGRDRPMLFSESLASHSRGWSGGMIGAAALLVVIAVGVPTRRWLLPPPVPIVKTGTLVIVTNPPGATALIDGAPAGATPLTQTIAAGSHNLELRGAGPSRTMAVTVSAGGRAVQYIELPGAAATVGQLNLRSEPSGALVTIDGVPRGATPLVADLAPGEHTLTLAGDLGWVTKAVLIESGETVSLAVPATSWSNVAP
jgi:hypothetical protein